MIKRKDWIRALSVFPEQEVHKIIEENFGELEVKHLKLPQSGLSLLKMKDSAQKEHYYLGEIPLSTAVVEITDSQGTKHKGGANVMHTSAQFATDLAICDAVLDGEIGNWGVIAEKVSEGMKQVNRQALVRNEILEKSKVDFSLLSEVGDEA